MRHSLQSSGQEGWRRKGRQKEAIDVPEPQKKDKKLDQLIDVHEHRIHRLEREKQDARMAWRDTRTKLKEQKEASRQAQDAADNYWREKRQEFLSMSITSGEIRYVKAVYERLKASAEEMRLEAANYLAVCKESKAAFFLARRTLSSANLHLEKLKVMRKELDLGSESAE